MAHDEQRAAVLAEEADEPLLRVVVEVVGRLVEQQELAAGEQDARELDPAPLAAGERVDREVEPALGEPETGGDAAHVGLRRVAARVAELLLGPGELGDVRSDGDSSIRSRSFSTRCAAASSPRPGQHVGEAGVVDARAPGLRVLGQVAQLVGAQHHARRDEGASPAMTLSIVVLPVPLRPTSPTLSPARSLNEAPSRVTRLPTSMRSSRT